MSQAPSNPTLPIVVVAVLVLGGLGYFLATRGGDDAPSQQGADAAVEAASTSAGPTSGADSGPTAPEPEGGTNAIASRKPIVALEGQSLGGAPPKPIAFGQSAGDEPLELPEIDWETLPENNRREEFEASVETLSDWVAELDPEYDAQLLGVDCSAPPCVVGMAFDGTSFGEDHSAKAGFQGGFADEITRLRGVRPDMTMVTATPDGTTAVWVYELPKDVADAEALHADMNESARLRHAEWMKAWSSARAGRVVPE